jgi:two-component system, NtrC family, nitrogen regulation sensor histidine kinase NtrY
MIGWLGWKQSAALGRTLTFRTKLFVLFTLALLITLGLVAVGVTTSARRGLDEVITQHSEAFVAQFEREFQKTEDDVVHKIQGIADAESTVRMAIDLSRPQADVSLYVNDALGVAQSHQLDFLDFVASDGSIISSAEFPSRFGNKIQWVTQSRNWALEGSFLMRVDTQGGPVLGVVAVSTVRVGDKNLYVVGGVKLGKDLLSTLVLPEGMRALLYQNLEPQFQPANLIDEAGPVIEAERFAPFIEEAQQHPVEQVFKISWQRDKSSAEVFHELPLLGRQKELLGVLLVGSSQRQVITLERSIRLLILEVVALGILFGFLISSWGAASVTGPVRNISEAALEVSEGNWNARVDVRGTREISHLAASFNHMTDQLSEQRERLLQAERVAAWREVARRLAHELKNSLFPLQDTIANLQRAKDEHPASFDAEFRESTAQLLAEVQNLKDVIARFSDFSRMPQPELAPVNLNDVVRNAIKLFEPRFGEVGRPPITPEMHLDENLPMIQADAALLHRAVENLLLNAMDAMPSGGVLMVRTTHEGSDVHIEISDTGTGLTSDEVERLFTPYYTTKHHGTGLGLAIVQSIVTDLNGRIWADSEAGVGTSFHIRLPEHQPLYSLASSVAPVPPAPLALPAAPDPTAPSDASSSAAPPPAVAETEKA